MRNTIFILGLVFFSFTTLQAQEKTVDKFQSRLPKDCFRSYKNWYKEDVIYIITKDETDAFLKLETDEKREQFIENFWRRRDPNPDTEINEYRDELYERIKFSNDNFTSGVPGWKTDRGRIYITLGKPNKIDKGKAAFENLADVLFEKWFYEQVNGVGKSFMIIFIDPTESNEFRLLKEKREEILEILSPQGLKILYN